MGVLRQRGRHRNNHLSRRIPTLTAFTFLLFSSASAITLAPQPSDGAVKHHPQREDKQNVSAPSAATVMQGTAATLDRDVVGVENRFDGPGSSPPSCRSKCGWCTPCQPVHVPVQPGLIIRLEYYPEAWRCKCGNKLFMP